MPKSTDITVREAELFYLPVQTRVPLKFGNQVLTHVECARARIVVEDRDGRRAEGWGETPMSIGWFWPSPLSWEARDGRMKRLSACLAKALLASGQYGHPLELGHEMLEGQLRTLLDEENAAHSAEEPMPYLAALACFSFLDLALYDALGMLVDRPVFETLGEEFLSSDLACFLEPKERFAGLRPPDFLCPRQERVPVWHMVGGLDAVEPSELTGQEPDDGYPVLLRDWIRRDGLRCLKLKLHGNDFDWDYGRLLSVGKIALEEGVTWLTTDFNCTVTDPAYVTEMLDRLLVEHPRLYGMLLYVEQPFPYDLEAHRIDVHSVSARKPLFLDESAHDWHSVRLGRELGWTGVALKAGKTFTGALLILCWARAHGMTIMVQDITNPMLAHIPQVLLAAHAGTIMGLEANAMQFYPEASLLEAAVHPGLYRRRDGVLDLSTVTGPGFGYEVARIGRTLPPPARL